MIAHTQMREGSACGYDGHVNDKMLVECAIVYVLCACVYVLLLFVFVFTCMNLVVEAHPRATKRVLVGYNGSCSDFFANFFCLFFKIYIIGP